MGEELGTTESFNQIAQGGNQEPVVQEQETRAPVEEAPKEKTFSLTEAEYKAAIQHSNLVNQLNSLPEEQINMVASILKGEPIKPVAPQQPSGERNHIEEGNMLIEGYKDVAENASKVSDIEKKLSQIEEYNQNQEKARVERESIKYYNGQMSRVKGKYQDHLSEADGDYIKKLGRIEMEKIYRSNGTVKMEDVNLEKIADNYFKSKNINPVNNNNSNVQSSQSSQGRFQPQQGQHRVQNISYESKADKPRSVENIIRMAVEKAVDKNMPQ